MPFLPVFSGKICPQASQAPERNDKVYGSEALPTVDDDKWGVVKPVVQLRVSRTRCCASRHVGWCHCEVGFYPL